MQTLYEELFFTIRSSIYIYLYIIYNLMIGPQSRSVRFSSALYKRKTILLSKYPFNGFTSYINTCLDNTGAVIVQSVWK